jgi:NAD(P)-dependent dehydrogenase (short-subunit alcohol dehydrogenase family)
LAWIILAKNMNALLTLENKTIVISGASAGIGRQCAITASNLGASLIIIGRNKERLKKTHAQLKPGGHLALCCDLTDSGQLKELLADAINKTDKVSGLIHSAGIEMTKPLQAMSKSDYENLFAVNVIAGFELSRIISHKKHISPKGGSFVFIGSVMGALGQPGKIGYCASKGALVAGVKAMALELCAKKIRVNCLLPGIVETEMTKKLFESMMPESKQAIVDKHPLGLGKPEDVAYLSSFLLSDLSRWITGESISIDGGYSAE